MKIALIRKSFSPFGGAERYVAELAGTLADAGHEVHLYARRWEKREGIVFHRVPVIGGTAFLEVLSFARNARAMLERESFDIIHGFERSTYQDIYRAGDGCHREWLLRRSEADGWLKRNTYLLNPRHRAILHVERELYRDPRLKLVVANSLRGRDEIVLHYGLDEDRIRVIYNGINDALLAPGRGRILPSDIPRRPGEKVLLFVGSGFERKNLATAIRALSLLGDPDVRLWVVGRDRVERYRRLARKLGVEQRVVFAGPRRDPVPFYANADAFLLPTIYEPFSNACLEASAFGLPVATTRVNGFSELIRPGENGVVVENPLDEEELAYAARTALRLQKIPRRSYPTVADNVREMIGIYHNLSAARSA